MIVEILFNAYISDNMSFYEGAPKHQLKEEAPPHKL